MKLQKNGMTRNSISVGKYHFFGEFLNPFLNENTKSKRVSFETNKFCLIDFKLLKHNKLKGKKNTLFNTF